MIGYAEPRVFLVGAGPGDPGLLTVRAVELLARADVVLYDQLVPKRLLDFAHPNAERMCVKDLPGKHPDKYPHIFDLMIERSRLGQTVVRLKGGDPLIFGRGGEEAEALAEAGVEYEIVPGVTAALAAAAYLEIPLTHRRHASAVALVTGHELPMKPGNKLDWEALAKFPGTLAIYMGIARLPLIVAELLRFGKSPETPAAIVERAGTGDMRTTYSTLVGLESARRQAGLEAPGLILIGEIVDHRVAQSWFEKKPLFGRRVLVTRPRRQAQGVMHTLERLGAVPYLLPTIEVREPLDWTAADAALAKVQAGNFDWLIFTSSNGVHAVMTRLKLLGKDVRALGHVKIAAIGDKTAEALAEYHIRAEVVPDQAVRSEGFAEQLKLHVSGTRILIARAEQGRDALRVKLAEIAAVEAVTVYRQVEAVDPNDDAMAALRRGEIHFVLLTSANIAKALVQSFDDTIRGRVQRGDIHLIAMSEEVDRTIRDAGLSTDEIAVEPSLTSLIEALIRSAASRAG